MSFALGMLLSFSQCGGSSGEEDGGETGGINGGDNPLFTQETRLLKQISSLSFDSKNTVQVNLSESDLGNENVLVLYSYDLDESTKARFDVEISDNSEPLTEITYPRNQALLESALHNNLDFVDEDHLSLALSAVEDVPDIGSERSFIIPSGNQERIVTSTLRFITDN